MEEEKYIAFLQWCIKVKDTSPKDENILPNVKGIDWRDLLAFAQKQTIVGLYWQGIQRLPADCTNKPSEDDVMDWMGEYAKIIHRNAKTNRTLSQIGLFLEKNSISYFVFKGQTVGSYYPVPEARTSGDIDFYVFKKDRGKTIDLLQKKEVQITDDHSGQHWEFSIDGIPFELHYHTAVFSQKKNQRYWDDTIETYFDDVLDHVDINSTSIPTLPPAMNAIYLFIHIYHHFLKEGIALRQFIDWMMFFEAKHKDIVLPELTAKLDKLGLLSAFKVFGAVLTEVLGMDAACFPYSLNESDKRYVDKIMTIVLRYGNFGKYGRKEQQGGWKHSVETGMRAVRHITQFFWLSPAENLLWIPKLTIRSIIKNRH